jgi:multiple antibiotic resistance protein
VDQSIADFLTFFTTVDPVGTLTIFVGLTASAPAKERARIARRAVGYSALILVGFILIGQLFLGSIGIRLAAFQLAGGIIFFLFGLQMVFGSGAAAASPAEAEGQDIAIFPLAVPSIASPGAILAAVVLTDNREFSIAEQATTTGLLLAVLGITLIVLLQANRIYGLLGKAGSNLLVRVMGMVLAGLAVEMILEAAAELRPLAEAAAG